MSLVDERNISMLVQIQVYVLYHSIQPQLYQNTHALKKNFDLKMGSIGYS